MVGRGCELVLLPGAGLSLSEPLGAAHGDLHANATSYAVLVLLRGLQSLLPLRSELPRRLDSGPSNAGEHRTHYDEMRRPHENTVH